MTQLKQWLKRHDTVRHGIAYMLTRLPFANRLHCPRGTVRQVHGLLWHTRLDVRGTGHRIEIAPDARLTDCRIFLRGDHHTVRIGAGCYLKEADIYLEDSGGTVTVGERTGICGKTQLASIEGKTVAIGRDCLFSSDIHVRTGDSHSVIDASTRERINPSADVVLGDRVWVGNGAMILKGVTVPDGCLIGAGSVVTKRIAEPNTAVAGNPAKPIKNNVTWSDARI